MLYLITADAPLEFKQGGREHVLAAGDSIFVRGGEVVTIQSQKRCRFTNIAVVLDDLRSLPTDVDDLAMRVVPRQCDMLGLLHAYIDMLRLRVDAASGARSEEHTSELQSLMRTSYAVFCLKKKHIEQPQCNRTTNY